MGRRVCILPIVIILMASCANAQAAYSLQDCVNLAMSKNVDVLSAQNDVIAAKSRASSAKSSYLPQISVQNVAFTWGDQSVLSQTTTGTALSVDQNIFDGGLREANARSASYGVKQNVAGMSRTLQTVTYNVSKAYYEVLRARHLAGVAEKNVEYNKGLKEQIQAKADVGEAAQIDVLPIEAQLASARVTLLRAKNSVRTSAIELQNVIGVSSKADFDVQEIDNPPAVEIAPMETYLASAKSRPDVTQYAAAVGSARATVRSKKISLYPRPTISANYQREISGGFTSSGSQMVGGIVFDLFNGGANRAEYRAAKAEHANAILQQQQADRDIDSQVEEAYLNLTSAKERLAASALSLEAANRNYQAQQERYAQGLGTPLDLLSAEVQFVTAQSDDVQARYDYYIAIAQMDYSVGSSAAAAGGKS